MSSRTGTRETGALQAEADRLPSYCAWRAENPEPDLQALAATYGGLGNVPPDAWAEFDRAHKEWLTRYRERWSGRW